MVIPIGYFIFPFVWAVGLLAAAFIVALTVDALRLARSPAYGLFRPLIGSLVRPKEAKTLTGATHVVFAGLCCRIAFDVPIAAAAMGFIILGDAAAALVGRRWGRFRIGGKSLEGSSAFFLVAAIWVTAIPAIPLWWGIAAAAVATVTELSSGYINDNLSVPLISGMFLHFVPQWF
jgi:dolichol kinase